MHPGLLRALDDSAVFIKGRYGPPRAATARAQEGFEPEEKKVDGLAVRKPSVTNVRDLPPRLGHVSNSCGPTGIVIELAMASHFQKDRRGAPIIVQDRPPDWIRLELNELDHLRTIQNRRSEHIGGMSVLMASASVP
jgi:hypothetical protein